jgi:hypothetical protein
MGKKPLLALLAIATFAAAVVVGTGATAAFAGEVTGNCNNAEPGSTANDNCKGSYGDSTDPRVANGRSWCSFSGQNDGNPPPGNAQSWGQDVSSGRVEPSETKGGDGSPGTECNPNKTNFGGDPERK